MSPNIVVNNVCKLPTSCAPGQQYVSATDSCSSCGANQTGNGITCTTCGANQHVSNNTCVDDPVPPPTCTVAQQLVQGACQDKTCDPGTILNKSTGKCEPVCASYERWDSVNKICRIPDEKQKSGLTGIVEECEIGSKMSHDYCCPSGTEWDSVTKRCITNVTCSLGQGKANNACYACGANQTGDGLTCSNCGADQYLDKNVCTTHPTCGPGQSYDSTTHTCKTCGSNEIGDGKSCTKCGFNQHVINNKCEDNGEGFPWWGIALAVGIPVVLGIGFLAYRRYSKRRPILTSRAIDNGLVFPERVRGFRHPRFDPTEDETNPMFNPDSLPPPPPLEEETGWCKRYSESKDAYYYDHPLKDSQWEMPNQKEIDICEYDKYLGNRWCKRTNKKGKTEYVNTATKEVQEIQPKQYVINGCRYSVPLDETQEETVTLRPTERVVHSTSGENSIERVVVQQDNGDLGAVKTATGNVRELARQFQNNKLNRSGRGLGKEVSIMSTLRSSLTSTQNKQRVLTEAEKQPSFTTTSEFQGDNPMTAANGSFKGQQSKSFKRKQEIFKMEPQQNVVNDQFSQYNPLRRRR
jgi:hypothetical protein